MDSNATGDAQAVSFTLDGRPVEVQVPGDETLLTTLRERVNVTSARLCCGIGVCGTCTVLLDGRAVSACLQLTAMTAGRTVTTAEGLLAPDGSLAPVQEAFVRRKAFQCSFCIPAMALTVHAALEADPGASAHEVREVLGGNLCRCGSYPQILEAVDDVVGGRATEGNS